MFNFEVESARHKIKYGEIDLEFKAGRWKPKRLCDRNALKLLGEKCSISNDYDISSNNPDVVFCFHGAFEHLEDD